MTINNLQTKFENNIVTYKGIIYAVDVHRKAMELSIYLIIFASTCNNVFLYLKVVQVFNI